MFSEEEIREGDSLGQSMADEYAKNRRYYVTLHMDLGPTPLPNLSKKRSRPCFGAKRSESPPQSM